MQRTVSVTELEKPFSQKVKDTIKAPDISMTIRGLPLKSS